MKYEELSKVSFVKLLPSLRSLIHCDEITDYESKRISAQRKFSQVLDGFSREVDRSGGIDPYICFFSERSPAEIRWTCVLHWITQIMPASFKFLCSSRFTNRPNIRRRMFWDVESVFWQTDKLYNKKTAERTYLWRDEFLLVFFLMFVDRASWYIRAIRTNWMHYLLPIYFNN
jgi:hypothetical protein